MHLKGDGWFFRKGLGYFGDDNHEYDSSGHISALLLNLSFLRLLAFFLIVGRQEYFLNYILFMETRRNLQPLKRTKDTQRVDIFV